MIEFLKNKTSVYNGLQMFAMVILAVVGTAAALCVGVEQTSTTMLLAWVGNIIFLYGCFYFIKISREIVNQYLIFWGCFFVFSYGQVFMYSIGVRYERLDLFEVYSTTVVNKYLIYFVLSTALMLLAAQIILKEKKHNEMIQKPVRPISGFSVKVVCIGLMIVSLYFFYDYIFYMISLVKDGGYNMLYNDKNIYETTALNGLSMFYVPMLIFLLVQDRKSKWKYLWLMLLIVPVILYLYIGLRGAALMIVIVTVFVWFNAVKKLNVKGFIVLAALVVILLIVILLVADTRGLSEKSFSVYVDVLIRQNSLGNTIINAIGELGASMQVWIRLQHIVPDQYGYGYGISYLGAILGIVPSFLMGGISFDHYFLLGDWITEIEQCEYGLAFSFFGETYYNFGWWGIVFSFVLALLLFKGLKGDFLGAKFESLNIGVVAIVVSSFLFLGRSTLGSTLRDIIYTVVIPLVMIWVLDEILHHTSLLSKIKLGYKGENNEKDD